jgi:CheY-like chemotaxis protein
MLQGKILIVEDNKELQALFKAQLESYGHAVLQAFCVVEAQAHFRLHRDEIVLIILDGYMSPDDQVRTTLQLIETLRHYYEFKGPMIAASNDPTMREDQMAAGCDHAIRQNKSEAIDIALNLFAVQEKQAAKTA